MEWQAKYEKIYANQLKNCQAQGPLSGPVYKGSIHFDLKQKSVNKCYTPI